ncbi:CDP-glycerol glycerophosphotransferase family protein [Porcipelethomonas sp.]|uniref:CDP-glycerol glycerophosphotransferase family protein n=1 Tax=Porcipelethomonas sp. TaxID=2981675 RepID=UPI003EF890F3
MINIKYLISAAASSVLQTYYIKKYYKLPLENNAVLFESKHGADLAGNIFRLLECVRKNYKDEYKIYLTCRPDKRNRIASLLKRYDINNIRLVSPKSTAYFKALAQAKYLFTDTSFTPRYIKKDGQIITNTWHGTPLKKMGRDVPSEIYSMGNIERNFLISDYLIYPNEYMKEKMISAYMLDGVFKGTVLNTGIPRNSIFFHPEKAKAMKEKLGFSDKQLFAYMPTWRGSLTARQKTEQINILSGFLEELDRKMTDNQLLMVKLHPFVNSDFDCSSYKHIIPMPGQYESYEVLNCADVLITDYSSVFYDFANTGRKIILFVYDEKDYLSERGIYVSMDSLPFPKTHNISELYSEMNLPKNYDDSNFRRYFCTYDCPDAAEKILEHVLKNQKSCSTEKISDTSKENVLFYSGNLIQNGITTSLLNLFDNIDTQKRRYYVTFVESSVKSEPLRAAKIPDTIRILPMPTKIQYTVFEGIALMLYFIFNCENKFTSRYMDRLYSREIKRFFSGIGFNSVVQFEGYGKNMIHLFKYFNCSTSIFVHNNMVNELKNKNIQHRNSLRAAYQSYSHVVPVTCDLIESVKETGGDGCRISVVPNCHSYKTVMARSELPVTFDDSTQSDISVGELENILNSSSLKIINIGRFSAEKGHDILISAFEKFYEENKNAFLIIIGGYGELYSETLQQAKMSSASSNIIIIKSMSNPMPVLKKCDLFILSSRYEGLGLTILEADTLGIPVISTNVCGPYGFMSSHGGYMTDPTPEAIYNGMKDFVNGKVKAMNVNYEEYNKHAAEAFEMLLD